MAVNGLELNGKIMALDDDGNVTINDNIYGGSASSTDYDNSTSNLTSNSVEDAINEVNTKADDLKTQVEEAKVFTYVDKDEDYTANVKEFVRMLEAITVTLPSDPSDSDRVGVIDVNGKAADEDYIVDGNGNNMYGEATMAMNIKWFSEVFQYVESLGEWRLESSPVTDA